MPILSLFSSSEKSKAFFMHFSACKINKSNISISSFIISDFNSEVSIILNFKNFFSFDFDANFCHLFLVTNTNFNSGIIKVSIFSLSESGFKQAIVL